MQKLNNYLWKYRYKVLNAFSKRIGKLIVRFYNRLRCEGSVISSSEGSLGIELEESIRRPRWP